MAGIDRTEAEALFTEAFRTEILSVAFRTFVALQTIRRIPMSNKKDKFPVLSALPTASFLASEGTKKPESKMTWDNVFITAEEIAVIVPIDDSVLADAQIDVAGQVTDAVGQEFSRVIDAAVFFGTGAPASWPTGGLFGQADPSHVVEYADIDSWGLLLDEVEDLGFDVTALWAARSIRGGLRNPIKNNIVYPDLSTTNVYGLTPQYPLGWDKTKALAIVADTSALAIGVRQDLTFSWSNQATLTDYGNLWEKDATALRAVMRVGFVVADPVNIETGNRDLPVAVLEPAAG